MQKIVAALSIFSLAAAAPQAYGGQPPAKAVPTKFTALSVRSASPIHYGQITASQQKLWINGKTESYCPPSLPAGSCPPGNITALAGGEGGLSMAVVVPGGQQVYVGPDGAVQYTQAHSALTPEGSIKDGWTHVASQSGDFGFLNWSGGLLACPTQEGPGPYQIFGNVPGLNVPNKDKCLGFQMVTGQLQGDARAGAWQYA